MKRILIASASVGAGHNRAAEALEAGCREYFSDRAQAQWFDSLRFTSRLFRAFYADSYMFMANRSPGVWGWIYKWMNRKVNARVQKVVKAVDHVTYNRFMDFVNRHRPDAIICTHFLPANVVLAHKGPKCPIPVYVVVTDYDAHLFWINRQAAGYFVACDEVKWILKENGYPEEKIHVTGIPIHPVFSRRRDRGEILRELGLRDGRPTILFMGGGFGLRPMKKALAKLLHLRHDFQMLVVAGKNERLRRQMAEIARGDPRVRIFGFVKTIQDFMQVSDFIISKSGGLTTAESLAMGLPMVVFAPTPGQEERNADYLLEKGAGLKVATLDVLDGKVAQLLEHPQLVQQMKKNALAYARPHAARDGIRVVLDQLAAVERKR